MSSQRETSSIGTREEVLNSGDVLRVREHGFRRQPGSTVGYQISRIVNSCVCATRPRVTFLSAPQEETDVAI